MGKRVVISKLIQRGMCLKNQNLTGASESKSESYCVHNHGDSQNRAHMSRNCKLQKAVTLSLELKMRHEYSGWKVNLEENRAARFSYLRKHLFML